jgi:hypothetical protein
MCDLGGSISLCDLPSVAYITLTLGSVFVVGMILSISTYLKSLRS